MILACFYYPYCRAQEKKSDAFYKYWKSVHQIFTKGHKSYEIGTNAYYKIIDTFGDDVLDGNKQINRKALGQKVFQKPLELKKLNEIVWPEILNLLCTQVNNEFVSESKKFFIVEAALLIGIYL